MNNDGFCFHSVVRQGKNKHSQLSSSKKTPKNRHRRPSKKNTFDRNLILKTKNRKEGEEGTIKVSTEISFE